MLTIKRSRLEEIRSEIIAAVDALPIRYVRKREEAAGKIWQEHLSELVEDGSEIKEHEEAEAVYWWTANGGSRKWPWIYPAVDLNYLICHGERKQNLALIVD